MNERLTRTLTPAQSADVIRYYDEHANGEARKNNWHDKKPLGHVALQTVLPRHSALPDSQPLLSVQEMGEGLEHIKNPPKSDEYYEALEVLVDKRNIPYSDARLILQAEGVN